MRHLFIASLIALLSACASKFPSPQNSSITLATGAPDGTALFQQSFEAHGGKHLDDLRNINVGLTGKWKQLIRRIQPLVTDFKYRVDSQERLLPKEGVYAALYNGPAGTKYVYRTPNSITVNYNDVQSDNTEVLSSTALTADSFHLFLLGPLALERWQDKATRLSDKRLNGKLHQRIHIARIPGLGKSARDEVVLWIDPETKLTRLVQITLEGHSTTKGAHVEVEYLDYVKLGKYTFPVNFFERVNAPIAIDAHAWHLIGLDINRDYTQEDLAGGFKNAAERLANANNLGQAQ